MSIFAKYPAEIAHFNSLLATEDNRADRMSAVESAIRIAESIVERDPNDADAFQLLGLAWYHFPGSSSWRSWRCRRALEQALTLEPDHPFARHYLACLVFDQERFEDAAKIIQKIPFDFFVECDQEWRALKNEEMKLVCALRISPDLFPVDDFDAFSKRFLDAQKREAEDISLGSWVNPQELREHVEWMIETGISLEDSRVSKILAFLSSAGYSNSFWSAHLNNGEKADD